MSKIKTIIEILIAIPFVILAIFLVVIMFPFYILSLPFQWLREKKYNKEYGEFLLSNNGKNFFCYNNRKQGRAFIEEQILPKLPSEIEVLFLNGRQLETNEYDKKFLSRAIYGFRNYTRFPHLLKIRNGEPVDCSINSEVFNCLNQEKNGSEVFVRINEFFEMTKMTPQD